MPIFYRGKGPVWVTAEHPGYKSKKDEQRGGTRREVAAARIQQAALNKITRKEKKNAAIAEWGRKAKEEQAALRKAARDKKQREAERTVTARQLREQRKAAKKRNR